MTPGPGPARRRRALGAGVSALWMAAAPAGCAGQSATAPDVPRSGRYALVSYRGLAVPADLGPEPYRDFTPSPCHHIVTGGELTLDLERGRFAYGYEVRDSCGQTRVGEPPLEGLAVARGREIRLIVPRAFGDTVTSTAYWERGAVTIGRGTNYVLVFR